MKFESILQYFWPALSDNWTWKFGRNKSGCFTQVVGNVLIKVSSLSAGFELTFFSGVYGTCISNNLWYGGEAKGLIGISGIFIGVGEILGKSSWKFCGNGHGSR